MGVQRACQIRRGRTGGVRVGRRPRFAALVDQQGPCTARRGPPALPHLHQGDRLAGSPPAGAVLRDRGPAGLEDGHTAQAQPVTGVHPGQHQQPEQQRGADRVHDLVVGRLELLADGRLERLPRGDLRVHLGQRVEQCVLDGASVGSAAGPHEVTEQDGGNARHIIATLIYVLIAASDSVPTRTPRTLRPLGDDG